jgi:hypothetical protein
MLAGNTSNDPIENKTKTSLPSKSEAKKTDEIQRN